jgi:hypothetical protein
MRNLVSWLLLFGMYLNVISPFVISANAQKTSGKTIAKTNMNVNLPEGLQFRLSEGEEGAETREKQLLAETNPLSEGDTNSLLKRIPEIKTDQDDQKDFNKRLGTLPAPKTGNMIPVKFPAAEQINPGSVDAAKIPLEVIRYSPEGEVPLAPDLNVTFSQPMVAVTSQEEAAKIVPVELTPQVEGKWRWLGTKTLMFDTTKRIRRPRASRDAQRKRTGFTKRCDVDVYDAAAEGRNDDSARPDYAARCADVCFVRPGNQCGSRFAGNESHGRRKTSDRSARNAGRN